MKTNTWQRGQEAGAYVSEYHLKILIMIPLPQELFILHLKIFLRSANNCSQWRQAC